MVGLSSRPENGLRAGLGWHGTSSTRNEMARSQECTDSYAQKVLDAADIVREAIFQQLNALQSLLALHARIHGMTM